MKLDTGTIIAIAAALIFYLRLIIIQRHKSNQANTSQLGIRIVSWYLLGMGLAFILLGALLTAYPLFGPAFSSYWWVILTLGILLLGLSIR
jgi:hypothetical protein